MIRVAFWFDTPIAYSGGLNYIGNLLYALSTVNRGEVHPYVFFADDVPQSVVDRFQQYATVVRTPILQRKTIPWLTHKVLYKFADSMVMANALLKRHGIELVSHSWSPYPGRRSIKVISWIPDFQYLHLPGMFPGLDEGKENRATRRMATLADAVIVSSEHAFSDLLSVVPRDRLPPVEVLRFVSQPFTAPDRPLPSLEQLRAKYDFDGKYFVLPNQFWAHKNHEVVLRALAQAKHAGLRMTVLMTGNTRDYRLSGEPYIDSLRNFIRDEGIEQEARILGMIEYEDLLGLMRHCVGFINPSRFEGWSSSVEEAKSIGKPVLMSRIPVHLEQAPAYGAYFDCDDATGLASLMCKLWDEHDSIDQDASAAMARADLVRRTKQFGQTYLNFIRRVAAGS